MPVPTPQLAEGPLSWHAGLGLRSPWNTMTDVRLMGGSVSVFTGCAPMSVA